MSTTPQTGAQRTIYVNLEQEPEVTEEVCCCNPDGVCTTDRLSRQGFAIGKT